VGSRAPQLKLLVDHSTAQVVVTGSSALRIERGRDSLAGRITTIEAGTLSLTEIAALRGIELGGPFLADNGHVGQMPSPQTFINELHTTLDAKVGAPVVRQYLQFLADTLLLRLIEPLELRLKKKASSPKICLTDHALRASWLHEEVPLVAEGLADLPALATMAGYLAESVVGATLSTINALALNYSPERKDQRELDFVMTIGTKRIPIEVKYQRSPDPVRDTQGLRSFIDKAVNNAPFGLLITQRDSEVDFGPKVLALPLSTLMLLR